jgi:lysozyme family protein
MFDKAINELMILEGGDRFSNVKGDYPTRYGISEPVARAFGYKGDMRDLPKDIADAIYKKEYWDKMHLDEVSKLSYPIAFELFEAGVNLGTSVAVKFLQRALNLFREKSLTVDGILGNQTIHALQYAKGISLIDTEILLRIINSQQCVYYMEIAEVYLHKRKFFEGWVKHRVKI